MNSVLERLWRILEANRTSTQEALGNDFLRDFAEWEERLRRKMKLDDDFEASYNRSRTNEPPPKREPTRDEKIAGYYANLEIPYGADLETVKKAYRKLMKQYHPDKFSGDLEKQKTATEISKRLNEAYQALEKYLQSRST
ncbi:MAG: J domain-containing protein [Chloroherpetonaceae bacterium]